MERELKYERYYMREEILKQKEAEESLDNEFEDEKEKGVFNKYKNL